jgi:hypothetical protein
MWDTLENGGDHDATWRRRAKVTPEIPAPMIAADISSSRFDRLYSGQE